MPSTPSIGIDQNQDDTFVDKYWGRVPMFLKWIPESYICEPNPEYLYIMELFIAGELNKDNFSDELYRELVNMVDLLCNPCKLTGKEKAIIRAFEGLPACTVPTSFLLCDDTICCNEMLSCEPPLDCPVTPEPTSGWKK